MKKINNKDNILMVSQSRMKSWRFCKQAHYYKYVENLELKRKPKKLKMGSIVHETEEAKFRGDDWHKILEEVKKEYNKMFPEEKEYYGNLPLIVETIMIGYEEKYHDDDDKFEYFTMEKQLPSIKLTDKIEFVMRPDKIVYQKSNGLAYLWETKTGKKIPSEDFRLWDFQTAIYIWAARKLGYPVDGIIWNYIRSKPPTVPKVLKNGSLSVRKNIDTDYRTYVKAIKDNNLKVEDYKERLEALKGNDKTFYRRMKLPVNEVTINKIVEDARKTALEIYYLQENPIREISAFSCNTCFYSSLCYAEMRNLDTDYVRKAEYQQRKNREKEDEENGKEEEA